MKPVFKMQTFKNNLGVKKNMKKILKQEATNEKTPMTVD